MSDRYEFIDAEYADDNAGGAGGAPTITCMCRSLGVSKSEFYEWRSRPDSATEESRRTLALIITGSAVRRRRPSRAGRAGLTRSSQPRSSAAVFVHYGMTRCLRPLPCRCTAV